MKMHRRFWKQVTIAFLPLLGFVATPAFAVPTLQLYVEGGTYYDHATISDGTNSVHVDDSWLTTDNPFTLDVVGANQPDQVMDIQNVRLIVSVPSQFYDSAGTVSISGEGLNVTLTDSDFTNGSPDPFNGDKNFPTHGMFPSYYSTVNLPDLMVDTAGEAVYDYNEDFDPDNLPASSPDTGDIQRYQIAYADLPYLHFDLVGTAFGENRFADGVNKIAPFSHDAEASGSPPAPVPEPATLLLFGAGITGLTGSLRKRRMKKTV